MSTRRPVFASLLALCAVLAQLWLNVLQAAPAAGGAFCGDHAPGRIAALTAQLPPELRLTLETIDSDAQADGRACAPTCCPALASAEPVADRLPRAQETPAEIAASTPAPLRSILRPPVRGPPQLH